MTTIDRRTIDVFIVGTGTVSVHQITREVDFAIRQSKEVLYVDNRFGVDDYLRRCCQCVTDLHKAAYRENENRLRAYSRMAAMVIEAALDHPPVTFALYGHPLVFALPPFQVIQGCQLLGLRAKIYPGMSCLDALFVDLRLDPSTQGLQMYEATDLLLRQRPLQPDVPCLIWQIGTVESQLYSSVKSRPERFNRIKEYLLNFYPAEHMLAAVASATHPLAASEITIFRLSDIEEHADALHQGVTVFIPPTKFRSIADQDLLTKIDNSDHLQGLLVERG